MANKYVKESSVGQPENDSWNQKSFAQFNSGQGQEAFSRINGSGEVKSLWIPETMKAGLPFRIGLDTEEKLLEVESKLRWIETKERNSPIKSEGEEQSQ